MRRVINRLAAPFAMLLAGCAAGGGGCGGCDGVTPLAEGFKPDARIENAGSARLTASGIEFLEQNLGTLAQSLLGDSSSGGILTFPIPSSSGSIFSGANYSICPDGPNENATPPRCVAEINLGAAQFQIDPQSPNVLRIHGPLPIRLQDLPIRTTIFGINGNARATLNGNDACPPNPQTFANINLDVNVTIEIDADPTHSRRGYTKVRVGNININEGQLRDSIDFNCGGSFTGAVLNGLKGVVMPFLMDGLIGTLGDQINSQLCQQANPALSPSCPVGTTDDGGTCMYPDGSCASIILGTDGHINLGQLLAGISPGTKGGLDFLFAAGGHSQRDDGSGRHWGDLNPVAGGATLGLYGGAEPLPVSNCVKFSDLPLPSAIPIPDELLGNAIDGWPDGVAGPHVGIALSERFTNYALSGVYNSGLLCLAISSDQIPLISSGTLGLLIQGVDSLGLQKEKQSVAIVVRPGTPPRIAFGNGTDVDSDPLIRLQLDQASFDFYMWSLDRYIRFMTATYDLDVPVNLEVTPEGLAPVLNKVGVKNGKVTNSGLLTGDPDGIAAALAELIEGQVGQALGGGIDPIDLNGSLASLGLSLTIPDSVPGQGSPGLRRLSKGSDNYLGIFASFGLASQSSSLVSHTHASIKSADIPVEGLRMATMTRDNAPRVTLVMGSDLDDGTRAMEYQVRVDQGVWRPFTQSRIIDLQDSWLRLQGRHVISVRSRVVGEPLSLDPTPVQVEVVVDVEAPAIQVSSVENGRATLSIEDAVSDTARAEVRYRLDGGAWSAWQKAAEVGAIEVGEAMDIDVEARDEVGNVATSTQALIRGRIEPGGDSGCGCEVAGSARSGGAAGWLVAGVLAAFGARLRRRRQNAGRGNAAGSLGAEAEVEAGAVEIEAKGPARSGGRRTLGRHATRGMLGGLLVMAVAGAQAGCNCGDVEVPSKPGAECGEDCTTLEAGLIGAYTSVAVDGEKVWVAGYAEGNRSFDFKWGDLVVGALEGDKVNWTAIDGVPSEPPVDPKRFDTEGFRGGQIEPGDDVGLWTSIAIGPDGGPAVAYFDRTNRRLKFAQYVGGAWLVSVVQEAARSDIGRYAKLLFVNGTPVIAYLAIEPGEDGAVTSSVRIARGNTAAPGAGQWSFEDVVADPATPCRAFACGSGTVCVASTGRCTARTEGCGTCSSGSECVDAGGQLSCQEVFTSDKLETYPDAVGAYVAMVPDQAGGVGVAFYDRIRGNAVIASKDSGSWKTLIVDGEAADGTNTGDVGMGLSLFIDEAKTWHLTYADGLSEGLRYAQVKNLSDVLPIEVIDDGLGIEGTRFEDGQHIVGDDSSLLVTSGGEVHVSYQDATSGKLRYAVGTSSGSAHSWLVRELPQQSFAGAFSKVVQVGGRIQIANWWRVGGASPAGDVAFVTP
ncbi:MYXO-CTERM sorting domain-containing protein [Chondromyces crocatus]|uniref:Uncharacterized protein n=1 Tax=Chondromyces crocatus TaxID=52 RepID=A0A0K1EIA4_CHOCO|nr:MYXO-CTERM sorting domain-containing protein [Chondromyces crocatus]AKT40427.1 uncharacterized protein CMC5_045800 [Chondromyces crocatus]